MGKADVTGKWLLGEDPAAWVRWMMADPRLEIEAFLSAEFQHVLRHSDILLRVRDADGLFLLLIELQLHYDPDMPWRMQAYAALAEEKYRLPAYPLVFYLLPPSPGVGLPEQYYYELRGLVTRRDFRVVKAWELDAREVLAEGPLALVPLTPLMQGAGEAVLRAGVQTLQERKAGEEMEAVLALFASFVMSPEQIRQIVRWEMAVLRESPWYQEIVQEGFLEGIQEGIQKGLVEAVLHLLQSRFELSDSAVERLTLQLQKVSEVEVLRQLLVAAATAERLDQFQAALERSDGFNDQGPNLDDQSANPTSP
ncbi:MAG: Rpn family recombination-promoting nuclease/putative transposase [Anaerolineae bacterium]